MVSINTNIDNRYELQDMIGSGGMGVVYRAYDRLTGDIIALKHVNAENYQMGDTISGTSPATISDYQVALAQEFSVLASLRHPYIISVLDYGFDNQRQPFFTMTLLQDVRNIVDYAKNLSISDRIGLVIQMMEALRYLHRHNIAHRDLKPDNVMVNNNQVKVLDFGLATAKQQGTEPDDTIVGTLQYMAPEKFDFESNNDKNIIADIYSAGIMTYEIITGKFPFEGDNFTDLIQQIMRTEPDFTPIADLDTAIDTNSLIAIIRGMIAKNPSQRYQTSSAVLEKMYELVGIEQADATEVRESFLQTAPFVGRDKELEYLQQALRFAFNQEGSAWLIGSKAGLGKTRLVEEMRVQALVRGALVLQGQSIGEASAPYQLWRAALRRLILEVEITTFEASVLQPLIPDIDRLLGYEVPDAPDIGAVASFNRLLKVITDVLMRCETPLVIILEDLHWSLEGLDVLRQVIPLTKNANILVIGTFRTEERPDLPQELSDTNYIELEELPQSSIAELTTAIIGVQDPRGQVVDMLNRETGGNVLFIIEVIRALVDEIGSLDNIGLMTLPQSMFGGGVQRVIRHRLKKMSQSDKDIFVMSAIMGKTIDVPVLKSIFGEDEVNTWLQTASDALFITVRDEKWRFSHNAIRDTLLKDIPIQKSHDMHQQVANAIESIYSPDAEATRLAFHWAQAGNQQKEAIYKSQVAHQAYNNGAFREASEHIQRLLYLYENELDTADNLQIAQFRRMLGACYIELGQLRLAIDTLIAVVDELRNPVPRGQFSLGLATLGELVRSWWHRVRPVNYQPKSELQREELRVASNAMNQIAELALGYDQEQVLALYASLRVLNMAEKLGPSVSLAYAYSGVALLWAGIGQRNFSETYLNLAHDLLKKDISDRARALATFTMGLVYAGWGDWNKSLEMAELCLDIADSIGDWRSWRQAIGLIGDVYHFQGNYTAALPKYIDAYNSTMRVGDTSQMAIQKAIRSRTLFMMGRYDEAIVAADEAWKLDEPTSIVKLNTTAVKALDTIRRENWVALYKVATELKQHIADNAFKIYVDYEGYSAYAESWVALLATDLNNSQIRKEAKTACETLHDFAKTYPIAKARANIMSARLALLQNDKNKARKLAQTAIKEAEKLNLQYDSALTSILMGQIESDDEYFLDAHRILKAIDGKWGIHQLNTLTSV